MERVGVVDHVSGTDPTAVPLQGPFFDHCVELVLGPVPATGFRVDRPRPAHPRHSLVGCEADLARGHRPAVLGGEGGDVDKPDQLAAGWAAGAGLDPILGPGRPRIVPEPQGALPLVRALSATFLCCGADVLGPGRVVRVPLGRDLGDVGDHGLPTSARPGGPPFLDRGLVPVPIRVDLGLSLPGRLHFRRHLVTVSGVKGVPYVSHSLEHPKPILATPLTRVQRLGLGRPGRRRRSLAAQGGIGTRGRLTGYQHAATLRPGSDKSF